MNSVNKHYVAEVQKVRVNITKNRDNSGRFNKIFNNLLVYSNDLMNVYENAIKDAKSDLEKEYSKQNSKNNKIRTNFVFGLIILIFIVSLLIMLLTKIAFVYEKQINENLKFKNRILGMLSHELRSPLKIIGIFINRISKKTTDETIKEQLKSISFTSNSLLIQGNQISDYTKNQHVGNKLVQVVFNLKNEINSILKSIEPYIESRGNQLIVNESINPEIEVFSDNAKINQLFMNIIGNANKFTENGRITVDTAVKPISDNVISLTTKIGDTRTGISK